MNKMNKIKRHITVLAIGNKTDYDSYQKFDQEEALFVDFVDKYKDTAVKQSKQTYKQGDEEEPDELTPIKRDDIMHTPLEKIVDLEEQIAYLLPTKKDKRSLLLMGGAAGHMAHPFDDMSLTFGDLKKIINMEI